MLQINISSKFCRLDLALKLDNKLVNVEMQVQREEAFRERSLFYWAKRYTSELQQGEDYKNLKQTVMISFIDFNMFDGDDYHTEVDAVIKNTNSFFIISLMFCSAFFFDQANVMIKLSVRLTAVLKFSL